MAWTWAFTAVSRATLTSRIIDDAVGGLRHGEGTIGQHQSCGVLCVGQVGLASPSTFASTHRTIDLVYLHTSHVQMTDKRHPVGPAPFDAEAANPA
jgi:hypothetical protein